MKMNLLSLFSSLGRKEWRRYTAILLEIYFFQRAPPPSEKASSHRLLRSGPEWRKGVGKAGGGGMAELNEGGFSDVDSPLTTDPPASSPALDAARGEMKDE